MIKVVFYGGNLVAFLAGKLKKGEREARDYYLSGEENLYYCSDSRNCNVINARDI